MREVWRCCRGCLDARGTKYVCHARCRYARGVLIGSSMQSCKELLASPVAKCPRQPSGAKPRNSLDTKKLISILNEH